VCDLPTGRIRTRQQRVRIRRAEPAVSRQPPVAVTTSTQSEPEAVAALHSLNADFVRALGERDSPWLRARVHDDFVCILDGGERVNRDEFLRLTRENKQDCIGCHDVDVRALGDAALVHGVVYPRNGGAIGAARYTTVWRFCDAWQLVAAQFTPLRKAHAASQSGYSSLRQARGSSGVPFGVRASSEK
jgi:hypothetical protein